MKKIKNENELLEVIENFFEEKRFKEVIKNIDENSFLCEKKYYEIIDYKIRANIELKDFFQAKRIIFNELELPYIPMEFEKKLNEYLKLVNSELNYRMSAYKTISIDELLDADNHIVMANLQFLTEYNLARYTKEFQYLLDRDDLTNLTKSLILAILSDQNVDHSFHLNKNGKYFLFNPKNSVDMRNYDAYNYFMDYLKKIEKKIDITQFIFIKNLIEMYLLDIYPDTLNESEYELLTHSIIYILNDVYKTEVLPLKKTIKDEKIEKMIKKLNNLINGI